jgi:hypothetical protein
LLCRGGLTRFGSAGIAERLTCCCCRCEHPAQRPANSGRQPGGGESGGGGSGRGESDSGRCNCICGGAVVDASLRVDSELLLASIPGGPSIAPPFFASELSDISVVPLVAWSTPAPPGSGNVGRALRCALSSFLC